MLAALVPRSARRFLRRIFCAAKENPASSPPRNLAETPVPASVEGPSPNANRISSCKKSSLFHRIHRQIAAEHFYSCIVTIPFRMKLMRKVRPQLTWNQIDPNSLDLKSRIFTLMQKIVGQGVTVLDVILSAAKDLSNRPQTPLPLACLLRSRVRWGQRIHGLTRAVSGRRKVMCEACPDH